MDIIKKVQFEQDKEIFLYLLQKTFDIDPRNGNVNFNKRFAEELIDQCNYMSEQYGDDSLKKIIEDK